MGKFKKGLLKVQKPGQGHSNHVFLNSSVINEVYVAKPAHLDFKILPQVGSEDIVFCFPGPEERNCVQRPGTFETSPTIIINSLSVNSETITVADSGDCHDGYSVCVPKSREVNSGECETASLSLCFLLLS